jgi:hypothetical protein
MTLALSQGNALRAVIPMCFHAPEVDLSVRGWRLTIEPNHDEN